MDQRSDDVPLIKAQERRRERAGLRRDLKSGTLNLELILLNCPDHVVELPLIHLIDMVPYVGYVRLAELNYEACKRGINICLPVGALTDRAKTFIIRWERERRGTASQ